MTDPQNASLSENLPDTDICIVGAGMVGSAVACGLANLGYRVTVIDQAAPPAYAPQSPPDIRVSALSYASECFLKDIGAWKHTQAMRSCPYRQLAVWEKLASPLSGAPLQSRLNKTQFDAQQVKLPYLGHIVENNVTQLALHQTMATKSSLQTVFGRRVKLLRVDNEYAVLTLDNGQCVRARLVVGADGAQSRVRELACIGLNSDQYEQQAMVITVSHASPQQEITWQAFTSTGPLAYLPLPAVDGQNYGSLVWYNLPENINKLMQLDDQSLMASIHKEFPSELPALQSIVSKGRFPLVKRHAQQYTTERVVLVGDAAHTINPLAGQGVNLGFKDAAALIAQLSLARASSEDPGKLSLLKKYEAMRRPANSQMMLLMDMFYHTFSNDIAPLKAVRNLGLHFANHAPWAKTKVLKYAIGLN
ncbi:MAG: FAD-dependent monooxygenase [Hahellaceae bacterium]|nr:FAD-dependent monooxygenase [Hahellaceae bacterium]MCP5210725.1 FAD-dependent monooxygenase [Hahellaceae bacterium]